MFIDLFNCQGKNDIEYGYVGEEDRGGWFFPSSD